MLLARVIVAGAAGVTVIASASSGSSLLQPAPLQPDWEMSAGGPHAFARYRAFQQSYPADVADPRLRDFAARARQGEDDLPDHLMPLMWLPEDPEDGDEALPEDELDVGREWALGFFEGVGLREEGWDRWLEEHDWIEDIFDLLERLVTGEVTDPEDPGKAATALPYRERLGIVMDLPGMLADLNHHHFESLTPRTPIRREAGPGRNDPCPCGSGKKYKKCCGAE